MWKQSLYEHGPHLRICNLQSCSMLKYKITFESSYVWSTFSKCQLLTIIVHSNSKATAGLSSDNKATKSSAMHWIRKQTQWILWGVSCVFLSTKKR
jgi:hypothetical protein